MLLDRVVILAQSKKISFSQYIVDVFLDLTNLLGQFDNLDHMLHYRLWQFKSFHLLLWKHKVGNPAFLWSKHHSVLVAAQKSNFVIAIMDRRLINPAMKRFEVLVKQILVRVYVC